MSASLDCSDTSTTILKFRDDCPFVLDTPPFLPIVVLGFVLLILVPGIFIFTCPRTKDVEDGSMYSISRSWRDPVAQFLVLVFVVAMIVFYNAICIDSGGLQAVFIVAELCVLTIVVFNPGGKSESNDTAIIGIDSDDDDDTKFKSPSSPLIKKNGGCCDILHRKSTQQKIHKASAFILFSGLLAVNSCIGAYHVFPTVSGNKAFASAFGIGLSIASVIWILFVLAAVGVFNWNDRVSAAEHVYIFVNLAMLLGITEGCIS